MIKLHGNPNNDYIKTKTMGSYINSLDYNILLTIHQSDVKSYCLCYKFRGKLVL